VRIETTPVPPVVEAAKPAVPVTPTVPVKNWLEAQVELARRGFSSGSIDAAVGPKTRAALRAFQENQLLLATGELDAATKARLQMAAPAIAPRTLTIAEIGALQPLSPTWLGKSQQTALAYETALEAAAEKYHAHPLLLKKFNPLVDWANVTADVPLNVPAIDRIEIAGRAARLEIRLAECVLEARDSTGKVIAHFPVSIGRLADSRPVGELHVTVVIPDPNYTFDPAVFPESAEARELGRKLILQPGPNNPVGVAWIGLDRPGYGIHGTPSPERVGAAESHGCFRLANWDARTLLSLAWVGLPVDVIAAATP
jgi:lipoprotein-anchoring transpeptidase ErfK/SrfK